MSNFYVKLVAVVTGIIFVVSVTPNLQGAEFFFKPRRGGGSSPSGELGVRVPFGDGSQPQSEIESVINELKDEETEGAGTAIGLMVLGACVVAAAVVIANKADDVKEDVIEKAEEIAQDKD